MLDGVVNYTIILVWQISFTDIYECKLQIQLWFEIAIACSKENKSIVLSHFNHLLQQVLVLETRVLLKATLLSCGSIANFVMTDIPSSLLPCLNVLLSFKNNNVQQRRRIHLSQNNSYSFLRCQACKILEAFVIVKTKWFVEKIMLKRQANRQSQQLRVL